MKKELGGRVLFDHLNMVLSPGARLGLLGKNGSGKSTLIRLLSGQLQPDSGQVWRAEGLRVVVFDQNRQQLDRDMTLRQALSLNGTDTVVYRDQGMHIRRGPVSSFSEPSNSTCRSTIFPAENNPA